MSWFPRHPAGCQCTECLKKTVALLQAQQSMRPMEMPMQSGYGTGICNNCSYPMNVGNTWSDPSQSFVPSLPATPLSTSAPMPNFDVLENLNLSNIDLSGCDLSDVDFSDCGLSVASDFSSSNPPAWSFTQEEMEQFNVFTAANAARTGLMTPTATTASTGGCTPADGCFDQQTPMASEFPPFLRPQFYNSEMPAFETDVEQDLEGRLIAAMPPINALPLDIPTPVLPMPDEQASPCRPTTSYRDLDFLEPQNQSTDVSGFRHQVENPATPCASCSSPASAFSGAGAQAKSPQPFVVNSESLLDALHDINMEMDEDSDDEETK